MFTSVYFWIYYFIGFFLAIYFFCLLVLRIGEKSKYISENLYKTDEINEEKTKTSYMVLIIVGILSYVSLFIVFILSFFIEDIAEMCDKVGKDAEKNKN